MSSSDQRPENRGFRSVFRCAISHYRQLPGLSAPEPTPAISVRIWGRRTIESNAHFKAAAPTKWALVHVGRCRPCWLRAMGDQDTVDNAD